MFNALWFQPDGGAERYGEYGAAVLPILADVGAELLFPFMPVGQSLEGGLDPDLVGFVRYPSMEAFDAMWRSDAYQSIAHLREEALTKAILTRCTIDPADAPTMSTLPPGVAVLNALWFREGGEASYDRYLAAAQPILEKRGGRVLSPRFRPERSLADEFLPDLMFLGHYPSTEALFEIVQSAEYQPVSEIRRDALLRSATTVLVIG
jgi:uncharacterized protein (DUF1330 family)